MTSPPSLDVVEDAVRRESGAQERRADAADTRAGFLLAFSALVVSLGAGGGWPVLALGSRALAVGAALSALAALQAPASEAREIDADRDSLIELGRLDARLASIDIALERFRTNGVLMRAKEARLRLARVLVTGAVALALLDATVEVVR